MLYGAIMRELIKQIRQYTGLSQTEMAKKIGVQYATINRWENGHSLPTRLAQEGLYNLCDEYNVPVYQMIIDKIYIYRDKTIRFKLKTDIEKLI